MSAVPDKIWFYRIIHRDNLEFALRNGLYAGTEPDRDPRYIFIGHSGLTEERLVYDIPLPGDHGQLGEYVPFYLGPRSVMLYNIHTGYRGVTKRDQREIIYLVYSLDDLLAQGAEILLTDGHAKSGQTTYLRPQDNLSVIDWETTRATDWKNSPSDWDRQRRKQAEGLVRRHVPTSCLKGIGTKDVKTAEICKQKVLNVILPHEIMVKPFPQGYY